MLTDANRRWLPEAVMTIIRPHGRYKAGPPTADHNDNLLTVTIISLTDGHPDQDLAAPVAAHSR